MKRTLSFAAAALLACSLVGCAPKSLLLVTQYPDDSPRVAEAMAAIKTRMSAENVPYSLTVYNTDMVGQTSPVWREEMNRVAVTYMHAADPCIVFVEGDLVARDFAPRAIELGRKVIFFDVEGDPAAYRLTDPAMVTGVTAAAPVAELFALMKQIVPSARGVAVLADNSIKGDAIIAQIDQARDLPIKVVQVKRAGTLDEWMTAIKDVQDQADVLVIASYSEVRKDAQSTATVPVPELLLATNKANKLPDFSFFKEAVGANGVLGAVTVPISTQARMAARLAVMALYYGVEFREEPIRACDDRSTFTSEERAMQLGVKLPADIGYAPAMPPAAPEMAPAKPAPAEPVVVPK